MQSVELTAKSVDEAKKAAAEKLGASIDALQITVLEETKGLFGKSSVRIRAELVSAPAPAEAPAAPVAEKPAEKPARGGRGSKAKPAPVAEPEPEAPVEAELAPKPARKGRGGKKEAAPATESTEAAPAEEEVVEIVATEEDANQLADLVRGLLETANLNVTVKPTGVAGRYVNVELNGKDVAFLVGKHGEVLNAMQYLANIIAGRKFANGVRVTLDGNDYRHRREEALTQYATGIAQQVQERGEEAVLDALPAFERRIVHKALSTYEGVSTYSEGEEPNRRVVIAPAD